MLYFPFLIILLVLACACVSQSATTSSNYTLLENRPEIQNESISPTTTAVPSVITAPGGIPDTKNTSSSIPVTISPNMTLSQNAGSIRTRETISPNAEFEPGSVLVIYKSELSARQRDTISSELNKQIGGVLFDTLAFKSTQLIHLPSNVSVTAAVYFYEQNSSVDYAQPNYIYHVAI